MEKEKSIFNGKSVTLAIIITFGLFFGMKKCANDAMRYDSQIKDYEYRRTQYMHKVYMLSVEDTAEIYDTNGALLGVSVTGSFCYDRPYDFVIRNDYERIRRGVYYFQDGKLVTSHSGWSSDSTLREKAIQELRERKGSI